MASDKEIAAAIADDCAFDTNKVKIAARIAAALTAARAEERKNRAAELPNTIMELAALRGKIDAKIQRIVLGDPTQGVTMPVGRALPPTPGETT